MGAGRGFRGAVITGAVALLALYCGSAAAQISRAVGDDSHVDTSSNKFLQREAVAGHEGSPPDEVQDPDLCPQNIAVRWHTEVGSSVFATPLITDLFSDGRKDIVVPGFRERVAVVEARDGALSPTFGGHHSSTLRASPLVYDIDYDGVRDVVVATYNGEVHFFKDTGDKAAYPYIIPRLRVKRDWYKGLNPDPVDHSHPDVGATADDSGLGERAAVGAQQAQRRRLMQVDAGGDGTGGTGGTDGGQASAGGAAHAQPQDGVAHGDAAARGEGLRQDVGETQAQGAAQGLEVSEEAAASFGELFAADEEEDSREKVEAMEGEEQARADGRWLDEEAAQAAFGSTDYEGVLSGLDVRTVMEGHQGRQERPEGLGEDGPPRPLDPAPAHAAPDVSRFYDDYRLAPLLDYSMRHRMWDDDLHTAPDHSAEEFVSPYVHIDAHVLATPAIGDLDGDSREELVLPVSYFFDPGTYAADSSKAARAVGADGDVANYVASGVVVYDLQTRGVKWTQHLDLSTSATRYVAHAYAPPTLADIDKDGRLEVIMGTSMGFLYALDAATGSALEGWPVQMGDITGQAAVGDLDGDGWLEVVAGDGRGSVAAFRASGKELWERHLGGAINAGATLADVDGDGRLEVVVGAADGLVHVLEGATGADLPGFPFRTFGRIAAPVLATKLNDPRARGLQLVTTSHDGFLYVIDALTACADSIDLGEPSYAMVLADDLAGSGRMDLLATTAGGTLYCIRTGAAYHPLKAWPAQAPGVGTASCTARWSWEGVHATRDSRVPRDVRGSAVPVRFVVTDRRGPLPGGRARGPYHVAVTLVGVGKKELNAGEQPVIGMVDVTNRTGAFTFDVPCPRSRASATIRVEMRDETGAVFADEFALSFHVHFYRLLKWMVVAPFAFTAAALLAFNGRHAAELPSFSPPPR